MSEQNGKEGREQIVSISRWTARENKIVMLDLLGEYSTREIGELVGLSATRVSQILKDHRAEDVRQAFRERSKEVMLQTVEEKLDRLAEKSVEKLDVTLTADIAATSKAKPNQDRVALKVLEGRQFLKSPDANRGGAGPLFSKEGEKRFLDMMEKANQVRDIDPFEDPSQLEEAVVVEDDGEE